MSQYALFVSGMADTDPHPPEIARAEAGIEAAQPVVAGHSTPELGPHLAGREVQFIVQDDDVLRLELEEARGLRHRAAARVHVGERLHHQSALIADQALGDVAAELASPRRQLVPPCDRISRHETDIVALARM